jgi:hypothetical protein
MMTQLIIIITLYNHMNVHPVVVLSDWILPRRLHRFHFMIGDVII